jgi:hypothetical protein
MDKNGIESVEWIVGEEKIRLKLVSYHTCQFCRWYEDDDPGYTAEDNKRCTNIRVVDNVVSFGFQEDSTHFMPPTDFGCNQWEDNNGAK